MQGRHNNDHTTVQIGWDTKDFELIGKQWLEAFAYSSCINFDQKLACCSVEIWNVLQALYDKSTKQRMSLSSLYFISTKTAVPICLMIFVTKVTWVQLTAGLFVPYTSCGIE